MEYRVREQNELKPSGVDWLGDIPINWEVSRLKYLANIKTGYTPSMDNLNNFSKTGMVWVKPDNLEEFKQITNSKVKISENAIKKQNIIKKDSILVCCIGSIGKFGIAGENLLTNQQINSLTFKTQIDDIFSKYLVYTLKDEHEKMANGNVVKILNSSSQGNIYSPLFNLDEQQKIANFLDKKSKVFDNAILKKEDLLTKLEDAKQALISEVVTGKLKVFEKDGKLQTIKRQKEELKPSNIEWLGDIPKDWNIKRLKYFTFKITSGSTPLGGSATYVDEGVSFLRSQNIHFNGISLDKVSFISYKVHELMIRSHVKRKDILINITGASIGRVTFVPEDFEEANVNQHVCIVRLNHQEAYYKYISIFLSTNYGQDQVFINQVGTSREGLTFEDLGNFKIVFPPRNEQKQISKYLDEKIITFNNIIEKTKQSIEKLKEAKESLISEAVTGKIEVL